MQQQMALMQEVRKLAAKSAKTPAAKTPVTPVVQARAKEETPNVPVHSPRRSPRRAKKRSPPKRVKVEVDLAESPQKKPKTLKRTLSFSEAIRSGKRRAKGPKEKMLRALVSARVAPIVDEFCAGKFHDEFSKLKNQEFFDAVSPIVLQITGPPEDCSDEEMPGKCMVLAKDILRKKKQYRDKKQGKAKTTKAKTTTKKSPTKRPRPTKGNKIKTVFFNTPM